MNSGTIVQRKSIPFTERDLADIAKLRGSADHQAAAAALLGARQQWVAAESESQMLHHVLEIGLRTIQDKVLEAGYEALASDPETIEYHAQARKHRRRPDWADEA